MSDDRSKLITELSCWFERKRIFVCCDGTWKNVSGTTAALMNVAKLSRAVTRSLSSRLLKECMEFLYFQTLGHVTFDLRII